MGFLVEIWNWLATRFGKSGDHQYLQMQQRARLDLSKGEAHHALKSALRIGRRAEIRDRTSGTQDFRFAGPNLLTAIINYWNADQLWHAIRERQCAGIKMCLRCFAATFRHWDGNTYS